MTIHVECYGQGVPLVMIHGWAMHSGVWRDFARQLAGSCQVICVDLPGHGQSAPVPEFTLPAVCDALLDAIPAAQFHVLGWSLGASVAIALAKRAPERVLGLQLLAGNPHFLATDSWPGVAPRVLEQFAAQMQGDIGVMLGRFLALQVNGLPEGRKRLSELKQSLALPTPPCTDNLLGGLQVLRDADLRNDLASLHGPLTLIQGDKDTLIPTATLAAVNAIRADARVHCLHGAGHVPFLTHREALAAIIGLAMSMVGGGVEKRRIRHAFAAAAAVYDQVADLQRQVALSLLARFPLQPRVGWVMDLGCGTGFLASQMSRNRDGQSLCAVDLALPMLAICAQRADSADVLVAGDAECLPFVDAGFEQIYSSLALQWSGQLQVALSEAHRVLSVGGRLVFSTLAEGSLWQLRQAWAAVDSYQHVNSFLSTQAIHSALAMPGWRNLQIEQQTITLYYPDALQLMRELKQLGAHPVGAGRRRKMTTRAQLQQVVDHYPRDSHGRIAASYQVIYVCAERADE